MLILDQNLLKSLFHAHLEIFIFCSFLISAFITAYLLPKVRYVVKEKNFYKGINGRSVHLGLVPALGGVAFFTTFIILLSGIQSIYNHPVGNYLIAGTTLIFMVGLKDDLIVSSPKVKVVGQLLATAFIVFSPEMQIVNFHGFLGLTTIPSVVGLVFSAFVIIALANCYNLIDGIDGLATGIGIVISASYGIVFYALGSYFFVIISAIVVGVLLGFLPFNYAKPEKKIFMGDSGSLVIGFILGVMTVKLLCTTKPLPSAILLHSSSLFIFVLSILFVLSVDTFRVIFTRLIHKRSPFLPDNNHIHHILLRYGMSHFQAALTLSLFNILIVVLFFLSGKGLSTFSITVEFIIIALVYMYGVHLLKAHAPGTSIRQQVVHPVEANV